MSEERQAKCTYYGAKTERMRKYGSCECDKCIKAMDGKPTGRCACIVPSKPNLAFFEAQPDQPYDKFYCGCLSWN